LGRVIGPAVAGGLIAWLGSGVTATGWVILLNAASYIAVILSLTRMHRDELTPVAPVPRARGQLRDGLRYVRSRPDIMLVLAVVFCAGTFGLNFQMTTALMATEVYGKGAGEYGVLGSVLAIGSLGGSLLAARRTQPRQRLVVGAAIAFGLAEMLAGTMPTYLTFALLLPLCGFTALTMITAANAFVQMSTAPQMRGRVMALYMAIFMGGTPAGAPALGWIAEQFGARWTLIGGGLLTVAGTAVATLAFARSQHVELSPRVLFAGVGHAGHERG
jgi:MFS family permease